MEAEALFAEPFRQYCPYPPRLRFAREPEHCVIRVAKQQRPSPEPWLDGRLPPPIEPLVPIEGGQQRRDSGALRRPLLWMTQGSAVEDPRLEPFVQGAPYPSLTYPLVEKAPPVARVYRVQEGVNIYLHHPAPAYLHQSLPPPLQRLLRRAPGPKALRARPKVLLVDGFEHPRYRPLKPFVFKGRYTDRSFRRALAFGPVGAPHRRGGVAARLAAGPQPLESLFPVRGLVRSLLALDPGGRVLARAPEGLAQELDSDVVGEAQTCPLRRFPCQFCYPLQCR